jgi:hypothetical protein
MRKWLASAGAGLLVGVLAALPASAAIKGDYVEVRSADVYTGPCFSNSQVNLEGKQAILAWKVRQGSWKGVELGGLGVVAVVEASATLGDPYHEALPARTVVIVDRRATSAQRGALVDFVKSNAGKLTSDVVRVEAAPIAMEMGAEHGSLKMQAGNLAAIETRSLCAGDHICGNEEVAYPPLAKVSHAMPAFTLAESFHGPGLGVEWNRAGSRSAFVGSFSL